MSRKATNCKSTTEHLARIAHFEVQPARLLTNKIEWPINYARDIRAVKCYGAAELLIAGVTSINDALQSKIANGLVDLNCVIVSRRTEAGSPRRLINEPYT